MDEFKVGRLVCHPRLPLVVGIDTERFAARMWGWDGGGLRELSAFLPSTPRNRLTWARRVLEVAWHPTEPTFVLAGPDGLLQWREEDGFQPLPGAPVEAAYRCLAFSPDGTTVWASPSSAGGEEAWDKSDALDWATRTLVTGLPGWDTDVVEHPAGGLLTTLHSDQGATLVLFADSKFQVLRRALILDVDGYGAPVFSADGRFFAIRGNSYEHHAQVFEFPSLRRELVLPLGDGDSYDSWSFHNLAFVADTLLIGTPQGTIAQLSVDQSRFVVHDLVGGKSITALAVGADGSVLVAADGLRLLEPGVFETIVDRQPPRAELVAAFLEGTSIAGDFSNFEEALDLTDGTQSFGSDVLDKTEADSDDPTWLQIRAQLNALPQDETP